MKSLIPINHPDWCFYDWIVESRPLSNRFPNNGKDSNVPHSETIIDPSAVDEAILAYSIRRSYEETTVSTLGSTRAPEAGFPIPSHLKPPIPESPYLTSHKDIRNICSHFPLSIQLPGNRASPRLQCNVTCQTQAFYMRVKKKMQGVRVSLIAA